MKSKTEKVKEFVLNKQYDKAFRIAKTFRIWDNEDDKEQVLLASEILQNKSFYQQVGKDVDLEYKKGIEILDRIYGDKK